MVAGACYEACYVEAVDLTSCQVGVCGLVYEVCDAIDEGCLAHSWFSYEDDVAFLLAREDAYGSVQFFFSSDEVFGCHVVRTVETSEVGCPLWLICGLSVVRRVIVRWVIVRWVIA